MRGPIDDGRLIPTALRVLRRNPLVWLFAALGYAGGYLLNPPGAAPVLACAAQLVWLYAFGLSIMGSASVLRRSYLDQTAGLKTSFREANSSLPRYAGTIALLGLVGVVPFLCFFTIARSMPYAYIVLLVGLITPYFALLGTHLQLVVITARLGVGHSAKIGFWHWKQDRAPKLALALTNGLLFFLLTAAPLIQAKGFTTEVLATGWEEASALKATPLMGLVTTVYGLLMWLFASAVITVLHMRRVGDSPAEKAAAAAAGVGPDPISLPG